MKRWTHFALLPVAASLSVTLGYLAAGGQANRLESKRFPKPLSSPISAAQPNARELSDGIVTGEIAFSRTFDLKEGETREIIAGLASPSSLPPNGRLAFEWSLENGAKHWPLSGPEVRARDRGDIPAAPNPAVRKILHALDPDVSFFYRAPVAGRYRLTLRVLNNTPWPETAPRWREKGHAPLLAVFPAAQAWTGKQAAVFARVMPANLGTDAEQERLRETVEVEPNDMPELAQTIRLAGGSDVRTWNVTGSADDAEFFDNGQVGTSGEDWLRLEFRGETPRLLTAQLAIPGQQVVARLRAYRLAPGTPSPPPGKLPSGLLPVEEFLGGEPVEVFSESKLVKVEAGRDQNERAHQQEEEYRTNISRMIQPGETYFLRVEANAPFYHLQLRVLPPPPYNDPRMAIRQGLYVHIGQVDAWLASRPRGASIERRIRDSGNLLGTNCMSCHTQSGVWGPAGPIAAGYMPENTLNYDRLQTIMYECLRPTNVLKDAANNTSLAPLDLGDGPAGTRAAGFAIATLEKLKQPKKLHSAMQIRTANYVLQTADPGGINAAGPGSNYGQLVVYTFASEILRTAWERTGDPKYFRGLEERAKKALELSPKYLDDVALRLDYFYRVAPEAFLKESHARAARAEQASGKELKSSIADIDAFLEKLRAQLDEDLRRVTQLQDKDGGWGFHPGNTADSGKTWSRPKEPSDPSPTALAIWGLSSAGRDKDDPEIARAVQWLLRAQEPSGRWNRAAITGFVTTSYVLHALSRLYPAPDSWADLGTAPNPGESLLAGVNRARSLALAGPVVRKRLLGLASHSSAAVRSWALIGLGLSPSAASVPSVIAALSSSSKPVRSVAAWSARMHLLENHGWPDILQTLERGSDAAREAAAVALNIRADAVMPGTPMPLEQLASAIGQAMTADRSPAVRAWAAKAAWQWWIWNPPMRKTIGTAWVRLLEQPEPNVLVENANRYSSQALFIANGHKANGSAEHQYKELADLFEILEKRLETAELATRQRLARRLVGIAGTFYTMSGGDGGPGQMGYATPGSADLMSAAVLVHLRTATKGQDEKEIRAGLEGAANVPNRNLIEYLVDYSLKGPEELRQLAASSISDPRSVSLQAVPEQVEPQLAQVMRGALEPPRRKQLSDPILDLWAKVNWVVPSTEEQQKAFFDRMIPKLDRYWSAAQLDAMQPGERANAERELSAAWYLAEGLGRVLSENPDLHREIVVYHYFPERFDNPVQAHYWLRSAGWILTFKAMAPMKAAKFAGARARTVGLLQSPANDQKPDPLLTIKDRALQLFLDMLRKEADARSRALAIRMANQPGFRTNPEVLRALQEALVYENRDDLRKAIENVLKQGFEKFLPDLQEALKTEKHESVAFEPSGEPKLRPEQLEDIVMFRDQIMPEIARQKRSDQQSCIGCHGVKGRVPTLYLEPPDDYGYLPVAGLLKNYRALQGKIDFANIERSKLLRKPLNIQDGKEDGHQGGRRYSPTDEGYLLLKRWAERQPAILRRN